MTEKERKQSNRELRAADESHLWPINNRFNVTERAIRFVVRYFDEPIDAEHYKAMVRSCISVFVNDPKNLPCMRR